MQLELRLLNIDGNQGPDIDLYLSLVVSPDSTHVPTQEVTLFFRLLGHSSTYPGTTLIIWYLLSGHPREHACKFQSALALTLHQSTG